MTEQFGDLMELVDEKKVYAYSSDPDDDIRLLKAQELRELGFVAKAEELEGELSKKIKLSRIANEKYITITDKMISDFLDRKVEKYNKAHEEKKPEANISLSEIIGNGRVPLPEIVQRQMDLGVHEIFLALRKQQQRQFQEVSGRTSFQFFTKRTCDFYNSEQGTIGKFEWKEENISTYKGIPPENVLDVLREHKDRELFDYFTIASVNAIRDPLLLGRIEGVEERFFIAQWGDDVTLDDIL